MMEELQTPITLMVFNRPETTAAVFNQIRHIRPRRLFVIADGARTTHPEDIEKCASVRAIIDDIDWECDVIKNYADTNMGLASRVSNGLAWVFDQVDRSIVLEDDCVPHLDFFRYCDALLDRYENDERIMAISGNNFLTYPPRTEYSYYFSRYNHCWGWASWARAWKQYDHAMKLWPTIRDGGWLHDMFNDTAAVQYWKTIFQNVYTGKTNSWAYRWTFACWVNSGLTILPQHNLVTNIGNDENATHTKNSGNTYKYESHALSFPLLHPPHMIRDAKADDYTQNYYFTRSMLNRMKSRVKGRVLGK